MKVLIIASGIPEKDTPLAGIFEFDQARALMEKGMEVMFFVVDLRSIRHKRKWGIRHFEKDGIQCGQISIPIGRPLAIRCKVGAHAIDALYQSFLDFSPDIIHAHFYDVGYMAACFAERHNIPLVITEHSSALDSNKIRRTVKKYVTQAYEKADCLVAVSSALAGNIKKHIGCDCRIVHNIVDISLFKPKREQAQNGFNIVTVGGLIPRKNHELLLEAFYLFHTKHPQSHLDIVGDGELRIYLQQKADMLGIGESVSFLGQLSREEISKVFQNSHLFALTSVYETFGVVCIEALASGLPVVTTDCDGPRDFINASNGIIVRGKSCRDFADGMSKAYENYKKYNQRTISEKTRAAFSPSEIAAQLIELYSLTIDKTKELRKGHEIKGKV